MINDYAPNFWSERRCADGFVESAVGHYFWYFSTLVVVVVLVLVLLRENKVNSYSDQLKLGWNCKFGVEFDNKKLDFKFVERLRSLS